MKRQWPMAMVIVLAMHGVAAAQESAPAVAHSVPVGEVTAIPLNLSLADAVRRGLAQNLAVIMQEQQVRDARGTRLEALSAVLPHASGSLKESRQVLSTAAFGFQLPGVPTVIGPFGLFDARLSVSSPLFDARALGGVRSVSATVRAEQADLRDVRETVVLAVGHLYLQAQADASRVEASRAEVATAETLARLAEDQRAAGLVAGIDVLRQQVQLESARARLIADENTFEKRKLSLARAIGIPAGQTLTLTDTIRFAGLPGITATDALASAMATRPDIAAAQARLDASRAARGAESAARLPSLHLDADLGVLGSTVSNVDKTYSVAAVLHVPIFEGGAASARILKADAEVRQREAALADLTSGARYDVDAAFLDIRAAEAAVAVADRARELTRQELEQAQDRFRAGISSTIELVQAQQAVAGAADQYIASVLAHTTAKAALARVMGQVEQRFVELVGGRQQ